MAKEDSLSLEFVKRWNFRWRRDYWYRQKFKVAFNSLVHRAMTPLDVAFEYAEQAFVEQQVKELEVEEKRKKDLKIHGLFTPRSDEHLWDKINWDSFKK